MTTLDALPQIFEGSLYGHQREAVSIFRDKGFAYLAHGMSCGKTLSTIVCAWLTTQDATSTPLMLVLTPKSVVPHWPLEIDRWWPDEVKPEALALNKGTGARKAKLVNEAVARASGRVGAPFQPVIVVINYESAASKTIHEVLSAQSWDLVVWDEAHRMKDPKGVQSRKIRSIGSRRRLCLSGTAMPNSEEDLWSQVSWLAPGSFPDSFPAFKARFLRYGLRPPHRIDEAWKAKLANLPERTRAICYELLEARKFKSAFRQDMRSRVERWCDGRIEGPQPFTPGQLGALDKNPKQVARYQKCLGVKDPVQWAAALSGFFHRVDTEDVIELPEYRDITVPIELGPDERRVYDALHENHMEELEQLSIDAWNDNSAAIKMRQVTGGTLKEEGGLRRFSNPAKQNALQDLLDGMPKDEPVVVMAQFRGDLELIEECAEGLCDRRFFELSGSRNELSEWQNDTGGSVLGVQLQAGREGVQMVRSSVCVYWSNGFRFGDYSQSRYRVRRKGQGRNVTYYHFVAVGTIDERVYRSLAKKQANVEKALEGV